MTKLKKVQPRYTIYQCGFEDIVPRLEKQSVHNFGSMKQWYASYSQNKNDSIYPIELIVTAEIGRAIVGCCVCLSKNDPRADTNIGVYVREKYRRRDIGTQLVCFAKPFFSKPIQAWKHNYTAEGFYTSLSL